MKKEDFEINYLEKQKKDLIYYIKNGNWEGYSDALKVRKDRLKEVEYKLSKLKRQPEQQSLF